MFTYYVDSCTKVRLIPFSPKGIQLLRNLPRLSVVVCDHGQPWLVLDGEWISPSSAGIRVEWLRLIEID